MTLSTLLLVGANLLPLLGVVFWGWDVFVLLILYWMETLVIAFWTIFRLVTMSNADREKMALKSNGQLLGRVGMGIFFSFHAGMFMTVHFIFLWTLFSGDWSRSIHGPAQFWDHMVIGMDLWVPLLFLFVVRGWQVVAYPIRRMLGFVDERPQVSDKILTSLYLRIFVMQFTIILGGWVALMFAGNMGVLVLLIVAKTIAEVFFDPIAGHVSQAVEKQKKAA